MSLKIFYCGYCGAKVQWNATECPVCNHLVSNDRAKFCIITTGVVIALLAVLVVLHMVF